MRAARVWYLSVCSDLVKRMFETRQRAAIPDDLETIDPGPELAAVLAGLDWDAITGRDLIRVLQAQQRQVAHYQAGLH
jgi:hypothetical protein